MSAWGPQGPLTSEPEPSPQHPQRLRAATFSELLSVSWRLYRRHWRLLTGLSLLLLAPAMILSAVVGIALYERLAFINTLEPGTLPSAERLRSFGEAILATTAVGLATGVFNAIAIVAYSHVASEDYHGRRPSFGGAVRTAIRRSLVAIGTYLLFVIGITAIVVGAIALGAVLAAAGGVQRGSGGPGVFLALLVGVVFAVLVAAAGRCAGRSRASSSPSSPSGRSMPWAGAGASRRAPRGGPSGWSCWSASSWASSAPSPPGSRRCSSTSS